MRFKILFLVNQTRSKTFQIIQQAYGNEETSCVRFLEWYWQKRWRGQGDLPQAHPPKKLTKLGSLCMKKAEEPFRILLSSSMSDMEQIRQSDLNMHHIVVKFGLHPKQKTHCWNLSRSSSAGSSTSKLRVSIGDVIWVYNYNWETKQQSSQCKSLASPRLRHPRSKMKSMQKWKRKYNFLSHLQNCAPWIHCQGPNG